MKPKSNSKKIIWIAIISIMVIAGFIAYNSMWVQAYYLNVKNNKFNVDDKMYAYDDMLADTGYSTIYLYRLARPMNDEDIDNLNIDEWKKPLMKQNLNPDGDIKNLYVAKTISFDSLRKYKTAVLGTYHGKEFVPINQEGKKRLVMFYAIKPNIKAINIGLSKEDMPRNYVFKDSSYYIASFDVKTKE